MSHCDLLHRHITASSHGTLRRRGQKVKEACLAAAIGLTLSFASPGWADNIASQGTAIMGVNNAIDADAGTPWFHVGTAANLNDGDLNTRTDTYFGDPPTDLGQSVSFVGIVWPNKVYNQITNLTLTMATFYDGGWFGAANKGPGAGGALNATYLVAPSIQVTTNGGLTWVLVSHTSDYMTVMNGHTIGGGANPNPTSKTSAFTFTPAISEINGIRIIGTNGGTADGNGFIGVSELAVQAEVVADSDGDGMVDVWERTYGLTVGIDDSADDFDGDGLTNYQEFLADTNPANIDTDGDGLEEGDEISLYGTNPALADTDADGLQDGDEILQYFTDPKSPDTDGDGLKDGAEVTTYQTDPLVADTDADGFSDGMEAQQGSDPNNFENYPDNLALIGTAIMGTSDAMEGGMDTPFFQGGVLANINDTILVSRVDTWNNAAPGTVSYVGILWNQPPIAPVVTLDLTLATFLDGGWFGVNNSGPGAGGALSATYLVEPTIQITMDGGASWTTVSHTSDYLTALEGHRIGGGAVPNPSSVTAKFTLDEPAEGITGIRIIGTEGGVASGGFLGVFELATRTLVTDSDNDGMNDAWERLHGLVVGTDDSAGDLDGDGLLNLSEYTAETDPQADDTDSDGLSDGAEVNEHQTNPLRADTDGDTLTDSAEINTHHTDPLAVDTDSDGFPDGMEVAQGSDPLSTASYPQNLAIIGTGILGTRDTVDSGTEVPFFNAGSAASINDDNLVTRVDTYNATAASTASFVGILWNQPLTNPIISLELNLAIFFDGGWFGVNNLSPGSGARLSAATHLAEPTVQVTTDGGVSWTTVAATSDYMTAMDNHPLPAVDYGEPTLAKSTFQLEEPQVGINGIRLIGTEGGLASGGFLGVFEFAALTTVADSDNDGMSDTWERLHGLVVGVNDAAADADQDGLTNGDEFANGTDPQVADTDEDGVSDGAEVHQHQTNPLQTDTDGDGLSDGIEVNTHHTNPLAKDTDGDGFADLTEVGQGTNPNNAVSLPANFALIGSGIMGTKESFESGEDTPFFQGGILASINDGSLVSRVDTWNNTTPGALSYVGVVWELPLTNYPVVGLDLTLATFWDGGWFGVNGVAPAAGEALNETYLAEPTVQVTTDGGVSWTTVAHTSDYLTAFNGHLIGGGAVPNPSSASAKFTLDEPILDINGIRLIGTEGGLGSGGFLGVFELAVLAKVPQPVTLINMAAASGQFRFEFDSQAGVTYVVQYKNALSDADWQTLKTITGDGTRQQVTDNAAGARRFYRVTNE